MQFVATDVFGNTVIGSLSAWDHIEKRHPEMKGHENDVKGAIEHPVSVHEGNTNNRRVFRGAEITTGFLKNSSPVAIVEYNKSGTGFLCTAYVSPLTPQAKVLWP